MDKHRGVYKLEGDYGLSAVEAASLKALGFPVVMVTTFTEVAQLEAHLKGAK